jgi:hypothetical protein
VEEDCRRDKRRWQDAMGDHLGFEIYGWFFFLDNGKNVPSFPP